MTKKKGQVTIFIIIALVIVAGVGLYFILVNDFSKDPSFEVEISSIHEEVIDCFEQSLERVLIINSLQGGYYNLAKNSLVYNDVLVPYYLIDKKILAPSKETLEKQISLGIKEEIKYCIDFSQNLNINVDFEKLDVETNIESNKVYSNLNLPINISKGEDSYLLKDFEITKKSSYLSFYEFANKIVLNQSGKTDEICLSCLEKNAEKFEYDLLIESLISEESYVLVHTISKENELYYFAFAFKFNEGYLDEN